MEAECERHSKRIRMERPEQADTRLKSEEYGEFPDFGVKEPIVVILPLGLENQNKLPCAIAMLPMIQSHAILTRAILLD
jgi:hypothetical protein